VHLRAGFDLKVESLELGPSGVELMFVRRVGKKQRATDRTVVLARASLEQFAGSLEFLDTLAELRAPTDIGSFFTRVAPREQAACGPPISRSARRGRAKMRRPSAFSTPV
jgi:hypothetical protein